MRRILAAHAAHALPVESKNTLATPTTPIADSERLERQRLAIAGVLKRSGLAGPSTTFVEFGAGDGSLSRTLWAGGLGSSFVLIDKNQAKVSRTTAAVAGSHADGFRPTVCCADVGALRADELRCAVSAGECVALSNHLCGCALDQALFCSLRAWVDGKAEGAAAPSCALGGIVAVTCCHHACTRETYLGADFLRAAGLGAADFDLLRKWSRMAPRRERPAATRPRVVEVAKALGVSASEAAELGTRCRVLLDTGRAHYLQEQGFDVSLVQHVPFALTADHVMLVAVRRAPPPAATPPSLPSSRARPPQQPSPQHAGRQGSGAAASELCQHCSEVEEDEPPRAGEPAAAPAEG